MAKEEFKRIASEDFEALQKWERQLSCLVHSRYLVGVGHTALEWMQGWWKRYAQPRAKVNENCADCVASFLQDVGKAYFKEKELRDAEATPAQQEAIREFEEETQEIAEKAEKKKAAPRKKKATTSKKG